MGQPTHFYPRRNPFLFTIDVPADFGDKEVVWTLNSQNTVARAFGSLYPDYRIDAQVISTEVGGAFGSLDDRLRSNIAPELEVRGDTYRSARVGEPVSLSVYARDPDDFPARPSVRHREHLSRSIAPFLHCRLVRTGSAILLVGLQGTGKRCQFRTGADEDLYGYAGLCQFAMVSAMHNSRAPEGNIWNSTVVFDRPGEYVLRGIASDGSLFTYQNVNVTVSP